MLGYVSGQIIDRQDQGACCRFVIKVANDNGHAVGYTIFCPSNHDKGEGDDCALWLAQVHDRCYGFNEKLSWKVFSCMADISGLTPTKIFDLLSKISPVELVTAIVSGDSSKISALKGFGSRTAERIVTLSRTRLQSRVESFGLEGISCMNPPDWLESASDMLIALGYSRKEVSTGVQDYLAQFPDSDDSEEAIRHVLQYR